MIKTKKQMFTIIGVFALVMLLGTVTYAFFNYTRTGGANTISTGRIAFSSEESPAVTLSDLFPITLGENEEVTASTPGVGSLSIHVTGDTAYGEGVEYLVKAVNVTGSNNISLPISISIGYEASEGQGKTIGTEDENYFTNRGGNTSRYKILSNDTISEGEDLVVGYIAPGQTGIDGNIIIMAYLDARNIAITDTYPSGLVRTVKTTNYSSSNCETILDGVTNASTYCATAEDLQDAIDNEDLTEAQMNLLVTNGIVEEYTNGTTTEWVDNRTVLTTAEWNQLQSSGVSFQVKVEANEGTWVVPTIPSCPGCKFIYTENEYYYSANNYNSSPISTLTTFENNNETLVDDYTTLNKNYFLGFKFDGNGVITNAYACGIKGTDYLNNEEQTPGVNAGTAFCVEGSTDGSTYSANNTFLNDSTTGIWQGRCDDSGSYVNCLGSVSAYAHSLGDVSVADDDGRCDVNGTGSADCY